MSERLPFLTTRKGRQWAYAASRGLRQPLRLPRLKLRLRALELPLVYLAYWAHVGVLYAWGLLAGGWWRVGTVALAAALLWLELRDREAGR